jgi:hypothetical protein
MVLGVENLTNFGFSLKCKPMACSVAPKVVGALK